MKTFEYKFGMLVDAATGKSANGYRHLVDWAEYTALKAENERLTRALAERAGGVADCHDENHSHSLHDWRMACVKCGAFRGSDLSTHPAEQAVTEADLLDGMAKHLNWELDWGILDPSDESSECAWRVHARSGNRNDREWALIGYSDTPSEALKATMEAGR